MMALTDVLKMTTIYRETLTKGKFDDESGSNGHKQCKAIAISLIAAIL